jgi:hypothetical protein
MTKRIAARKAKGVAPTEAITTGPTESITGPTEAITAPTDTIGTGETYAEQMAKRIAARKAKGITTVSTITGLEKPVIPTAEDIEAASTGLATTAAEGATSALANATGLPPALGTHAARAAAYAAARKKKLTVQSVETVLADAETKALADASKAAKEQGEQAVASSKRAATLAREALEKSDL